MTKSRKYMDMLRQHLFKRFIAVFGVIKIQALLADKAGNRHSILSHKEYYGK